MFSSPPPLSASANNPNDPNDPSATSSHSSSSSDADGQRQTGRVRFRRSVPDDAAAPSPSPIDQLSDFSYDNTSSMGSADRVPSASPTPTESGTPLRSPFKQLLFGLPACSISVSLTFVNVATISSIYAYLYTPILHLLPVYSPLSDQTCMRILCVCFVVLLVEHILEWSSRPANYAKLIRSSRAYEPLVVAAPNTYYLVVEFLALVGILFEIIIAFGPSLHVFGIGLPSECTDNIAAAVLGSSFSDEATGIDEGKLLSAKGLLVVSFLGSLRVVGLYRRWNSGFIREQQKVLMEENTTLISTAQPRSSPYFTSSSDASSSDTSSPASASPPSPPPRTIKKNADFLVPVNLQNAIFIHNSYRVIFFVLLWLAVNEVLKFQSRAKATSFEPAQMLNKINVMFPDPSQCDELELFVTDWLFQTSNALNSTLTPVRSFRIAAVAALDVNGVTAHVLAASIVPVRCPFQLGERGIFTIAGCPPNVTDRRTIDDRVACIPKVEAFDLLYITANTNLSISLIEALSHGALRNSEISQEVHITGDCRAALYIDRSAEMASHSFFDLLQKLSLLTFLVLATRSLNSFCFKEVIGPVSVLLSVLSYYGKNPLAPIKHPSDSPRGSIERDLFRRYETELLMSTTEKISEVLRMCLGVAGVAIVSESIGDTLSRTYLPDNLPLEAASGGGRNIYAIFAFVSIRDFDEISAALQKDVFKFVNDIAAIVHSETERWSQSNSGQCNRNLGSGFLLVWRIGEQRDIQGHLESVAGSIFGTEGIDSIYSPESETEIEDGGTSSGSAGRARSISALSLKNLPGINAFADKAFLAMAKVFSTIRSNNCFLLKSVDKKNLRGLSNAVAHWRMDPRLTGTPFLLPCGADFNPGYDLDVSIGMSAGWGVEGCVGSIFKVDATYISSHVNNAARLNQACSQYGAPLLVDESLRELLSESRKEKLRFIDVAKMKGSAIPRKLYSFGAGYCSGVKPAPYFRLAKKYNKPAIKSRIDPWETESDLKQICEGSCAEFRKVFSDGLQLYLAGQNWNEAIETLQCAIKVLRGYHSSSSQVGFCCDNTNGDGPSLALMKYMKLNITREGKAPTDWPGYRLLEKN